LCFGRHQFDCDSLEIVMIVSVTRGDLRDESIMADEAFALSPISARAAQPSEEDYDAISEAFMETSRGRWFLGEYAKRNRNADTRMVLDAVARIEENLAAQKQLAPESGLEEALAAIRSAVDEARAAATAALDSLALEEKLAPVRKGARVIREIAWRLREIGADGRICDLIDSQVSAIETGCGQTSSAGGRTALSAAFDLIEGRLAELDDSDAAPRQAYQEEAHQEAGSPPFPAASDEPTAALLEQAQTATDAETAMSTEASPADAVVAAAEASEVIAEAPGVSAEAAEARTEVADMTAEAADAHDDAVLEMIALEMAAPDLSDTVIDDTGSNTDIDTGSDEMRAAELPPAEPETIAEMPKAPAMQAMATTIQPSAPPSLEPSLEPSLGSTLVASGIVRSPKPSASDPLAPIRRMSQAEKIAFFS
jgi:hypothetical protein